MSRLVMGHESCSVSTGIHDGLTFGRGALDDYGYWSIPCAICARAYELLRPEATPCWPFEKQEEEGIYERQA